MGLRRLSCGLIASSPSTTNWSWRPGIISSNQFSHLSDRSNIFKHNIGDAEGQACIGLKLIGSSGKKTWGGNGGIACWDVFVVGEVAFLMAKVQKWVLCPQVQSYSYAVANTRLALPLPLSVDLPHICANIYFPLGGGTACTMHKKQLLNFCFWSWNILRLWCKYMNPEKVPMVAEIGVHTIQMKGPHILLLPLPSIVRSPLTASTFALSCMRSWPGVTYCSILFGRFIYNVAISGDQGWSLLHIDTSFSTGTCLDWERNTFKVLLYYTEIGYFCISGHYKWAFLQRSEAQKSIFVPTDPMLLKNECENYQLSICQEPVVIEWALGKLESWAPDSWAPIVQGQTFRGPICLEPQKIMINKMISIIMSTRTRKLQEEQKQREE